MKLLLDSAVLIHADIAPERLPAAVVRALSDPGNQRIISVASLWEIALKVGTGRLELSTALNDFLAAQSANLQATELPIRHLHLTMSATLPLHHRDPFDRMLVAQALVEGLTIVTSDRYIPLYGAPVLW